MPTRVEKHLIRPSSPYFAMPFEFCHLAKNLYNHANYIVRDKFIHEHEIVGYAKLDKILKADKEYPNYRAMPLAQSAQQVIGRDILSPRRITRKIPTNILDDRSCRSIRRKMDYLFSR